MKQDRKKHKEQKSWQVSRSQINLKRKLNGISRIKNDCMNFYK